MSLQKITYDREKAVAYANYWAYRRNPKFYNFQDIGGDCTNFASQCLYTGIPVMNFNYPLGWFYKDVNNRAPAWTSVKFFYDFLTTNKDVGPYGVNSDIKDLEIGDFVQIKFWDTKEFAHTPVIVKINGEHNLDNIYIAAHTNDCNCRPLSTYKGVEKFRYIHILGGNKA